MGKLVLALAALLALSGFAPAAASAGTLADPGVVTIVSPADGASLDDWDGSWSVDFSNAPAGQYVWTISYYGGSWTSQSNGYYDSTAGVHQFQTWAAPASTEVTLHVWLAADPSVTDSHTFHVKGHPSPTVVGLSQDSDATLYDWNGYATLDFTGARPGAWDVGVYRDGDNDLDWVPVTYDGTPGTVRQRVLLDSDPEHTYYSIYFRQGQQDFGSFGFHNDAGLKLGKVTPSVPSFYPTVRDGFRDTVDLTWSVSRASTSLVRVTNQAGRLMWTKVVERSSAGRASTTWNGKDRNGRIVPVGTYQVSVRGTADDGPSATAKGGRIKVVTDTVKDTRTAARAGTQTAKRQRSGDCYYTAYDGELSIDCVGYTQRSHAEARYGFTLPASATNLQWKMHGSLRCCARGDYQRGLVRTDKTHAYVYLRLSRLRAYDVDRVTLTYDYRRRR